MNMEILHYPDPRLRFENLPLGSWSEDAARKVEQMKVVLGRVRGAGLAAPQIGWNVRLFILSIPERGHPNTERVIFDPVITSVGRMINMEEGCLSFPGMSASIARYDTIRLRGQTPEGPIDQELVAFESHAVQHEMDHLNGVLYIDKMTPADLKRNTPMIRAFEAQWRRQHPNE